MSIRRADELVDEVLAQAARCPEFAATAGVADERVAAVGTTFRRLE